MENKDYKRGFEDGYKKVLDDHNILYGKAAQKFLEEMKCTEEKGPSEEHRKLLKEAMEIYNGKKTISSKDA